MLKIANPLSVLLSLLLATTSVPASACDLSCWFHFAYSECHIPRPSSREAGQIKSKPAAMDMQSHHCGSSIGPRASDGAPSQSAPSHTGIRVVNAGAAHSETASSCAQERCHQPSASASLTEGSVSQGDPLNAPELGIVSRISTSVSPQPIRLKSPPSVVSETDRLTISLRI
jgi:hypothetical protein